MTAKYKKIIGGSLFLGLALVLLWSLFYNNKKEIINNEKAPAMNQDEIKLQEPDKTSRVSIEESLSQRRSVRDYKDEPLNIKEISQILWAAQGITSWVSGGRTAPSAGALYPLEVYLVVKKADEIKPGVYKYLPEDHKLINVIDEDVSDRLAKAALEQNFVADAPVNLVFSGVYSRTTGKYGERGVQYVHMEAGHAAQNVYLQAESLGLGTVTVGGFNVKETKQILKMPAEETPLYIMPVGKI